MAVEAALVAVAALAISHPPLRRRVPPHSIGGVLFHRAFEGFEPLAQPKHAFAVLGHSDSSLDFVETLDYV